MQRICMVRVPVLSDYSGSMVRRNRDRARDDSSSCSHVGANYTAAAAARDESWKAKRSPLSARAIQ